MPIPAKVKTAGSHIFTGFFWCVGGTLAVICTLAALKWMGVTV